MKFQYYRSVIFLLCTSLLFLSANAQFEEGKRDIRSGYPRMEGTNLSNTSPHPSNTLTYAATSGETGKTIQNIITFKINESSSVYFASGFTATVYFTIDSKDTITSTAVTTHKSLTVNFDKAPGAKYDVRSYIVLPTAQQEVKVTVDSINVTGQSGWDPRAVLELENEMRIVRYYDLSSVASQLLPISVSDTNKTDALKVVWNWDPLCHNNLSQLEWAYVETEMEDYYTVGGSLDYNKLFKSNSTRVDLDYSSDSFRIPLLYPGPGKLYYRLRPALRRNTGAVIVGPWSTPVAYSFAGHELSMNWQSSTSFAENGKLKSVIQYFDGSLRNRQTVTKDNSTGNTIVGETIYDLQGRPNIQILPTPTIDNTIKYFQNFNRFVGQSGEEDPSRYFDLTPAGVQCSRAVALDTVGNGKYYSNQNPWLALEAKSKFIPDAQGYAFTETRLMDDATGRVRSQGGVGLTHQINNGHDTKYYYGKPSQPELDALFATEVGDASHYTKNMVQDANGQMSVSYTDMHGRTIATALAGNPTSGIDSIINAANYPLATGLLTNQLLTPATNIISGTSIEAVNSILVPAANNYAFTYKLDPAILKQFACNESAICFDCKYDLEISIRSEDCGDSTPIIRRYQNLQVVPANNACSISMGFKGPGADTLNKVINFNQFLSTGSYIIRKTLTVNDSMFRVRRDSALKVFLCRTEQQLYDSVVSILYATSGCGLPPGNTSGCDSCRNNLGTRAQYRHSYLMAIGQDTAASNTTYNTEIITNYIADSLSCVQACGISPQLSTLASLRNQMLGDMMPFMGQYAIDSIRNDTTGSVTAITSSMAQARYNIFTTTPIIAGLTKPFYKYPKTETGTGSFYFDEEGSIDSTAHGHDADGHVILDTMTRDVFAGAFKRDWASSLIYYHPEFSKLKLAEGSLRASYEWLDRFMACESYQVAVDSNYVHPTVSDPFFSGGFGSTDIATMNQYLTVHMGTNAANPSIWRVANGMVLCAGETDANKPGCINLKDSAGIQSGLTTNQQNAVWENFKSMYVSNRNEMVLKYINLHEAAVLPVSRMDSLKNEGKTLVFATAQDLADQNGWTWWSGINSETPDTTGIGVYTSTVMPVNPCAAQRPFWRARLLQCEQLVELLNNQSGTDSATVNTILQDILDGMESVCTHSITPQQMYGASNVAPSYAGSPQSFEEVINGVFATHGIHTVPGNNYYCNPFTIDFPKPYGLNPSIAVNNSNVIDSCACGRFAALKLEAGADSSTFISMNHFLNVNYHDSLTLPLWQALQLCNGVSNCNYTLIAATDTLPILGRPQSLAPTNNVGTTGCEKPVIYSADWVGDINLQGQKKLVITYGNVSQNGVVRIYNDTTYVNGISVNPDSSTVSFYLDSCASYKLILFQYGDTCFGESEPFYVDPAPGCQECVRPVINSVSVLPQLSSSGNEIVGIHYTVPAGSINCSVTVYAYYFSSSFGEYFTRPLNCAATYDTIHLLPCLRYKFVVNSTSPDGLCKRTSSFFASIDSCYQVTCDTTAGTIVLNDFVTVPAFLNCGYQKPCVTCGKLDSLTAEFHSLYPAYNSVPFTDSTATDEQARQNNLWARFLNYRTGFSKNAIDYLQAYRGCLSAAPTSNALCSFDPPLNDPSDIYPVDTVPCRQVETQAHFIAQQLYNNIKDSLIAKFDSLYLAKCLSAKYTEQFYVRYQPKEYHYTLYYYDQAGNLVKTMPPAAVKPNYDASYLANVITKRDANDDLANSLHNEALGTNYRYNSLNQVMVQKTPDAGTSKFWYDKLGRLSVSQNAKQASLNNYSYTLYDLLGRITEVGERPNSTAMTQVISQNASGLASWIADNSAGVKQQVTLTVYDLAYTPLAVTVANMAGLYQQNLRNRVSYSSIQHIEDGVAAHWDAATFYSYDIHGNVDTLLQDFRTGMGAITCLDNDTLKANRFKKIVYNYDLISGKVNTVAYQPGSADQFYHRYEYDAENKLTLVQTSKDKIYWEREATYDYYRHGPLARTVLGQNQVQGQDYAYTIEGWLKGVNSSAILAAATGNSYDMGTDGTGLLHPLVARDAYGYSLNYFNGDYKPIGGNSAFTRLSLPLPVDASTGISTGYSLYNGNIAAMAVNIPKLGTPKVYGYRYDQLNRIKRMDAINGMSAADTTITPVRTANYHEEVKYDPNGNILGYLRNGTTENGGPLEMDSLNYEYIANTNKLKRVTDKTAYSNNYKSDIDHQPDATNYTYDAIGNLVQDKAEGITLIEWTVNRKLKSISKSNGATLVYTYDASGNRISQTNTKDAVIKRTYYVRDALGSILSIYEMKDTLKQKEINLYGSNRVGMYKVNVDVQSCTTVSAEVTKFTRGNKLFELSNHLGNVLATVNDKKIPVPASGNTAVDYYTAEMVTATDYYPFGMLMPVRQYYSDTATYTVGNTSTTVLVEDTTLSQLYKHSFNDTPSTHPYVTVPNVLNSSLSGSSWTNHRGIWTSYAGNTGAGRTIAFDNSTADTARLTLSLNIASGKKATIKSFSFFHRASLSGYRRWKMYINGIEVGQDTVYLSSTGSGANTLRTTGTRNVLNAVSDLTATITVLMKLYDHDLAYPNGNAGGTFRMDDFILNGYVNDGGLSAENGVQYANMGGYRYGFNGQEKSDEIKGEGNSYTAEFWEYDPRIGRRWNLDPKPSFGISEYSAFLNSPISNADIMGDTPVNKIGGGTYELDPGTFKVHDGKVRNLVGSSVTVQPPANTLERFTLTGDNLTGGSITFVAMFGDKSGKFLGYFWDRKPDVSYDAFLEEGERIVYNNYVRHANDDMWDPDLTEDEARKNFINSSLGVTMPAIHIRPLTIFNASQKVLNSPIIREVKDYINLFKPINEFDVTKTLYRGTTGTEGVKPSLFLTDDATVAATYITNGGQVMEYQMTQYSLKELQMKGELLLKTGINGPTGIPSTEFQFVGKNLVDAVNKIGKPHN
ncbi:DUF6443 domain-containing protein [Ferruginibacter sp. HRS2-29]|uniref:DUF6443 domain-containing protein n=1 Tax=Ferruginibacter sp. HRS2-29 TaxID=2487334 RepID=UPI0020CEDA96|nr:DUF6443 domain-containing protein [Ferruginibacter sp. HRS2-29]MCP9751013.1 hypothetical protein [Ferruginibacter sp. HRS2-29]